jgi:acyl-CoA synthetase (NDP forming)
LPEYDDLNRIIHEAPRPVLLTSNTCMDLSPIAKLVVERTGLHWTPGIEHGMRAIGRFRWWSDFINSAPQSLEAETPPSIRSTHPFKGTWSEAEARALLEQAGIPTVPATLATTADEAAEVARLVGLPVALKIQSPDLPHKTDVGGVTLNLTSQEAVRTEFVAMLARVQSKRPDAGIEGILVTPMRPAGTELLVGVVRDDVWGLVLTVGLGGIWTEVLKDTAVRILPVRREEVLQMLAELRGAPLLHGTRGHEGTDLEKVSEVIYRISSLAQALGRHLGALEINPLLVDGARVEALDVLVHWQEEAIVARRVR